MIEIGLDARRQRMIGDPFIGHRIGQRLVRIEIGQQPADIRPVILGQKARLAGHQIEPDQRRHIAPAAVHHQRRAAIRREVIGRMRCQRVLRAGPQPFCPATRTVRPQGDGAAIRLQPQGQPGGEVVIADEAGEPGIFRDQCLRPRRDLDAVEIEEARVAPVMGDEDALRMPGGKLIDARLRALMRREVAHRRGLDIDGMDMPVLVAVLVLQHQDVARIMRPLIGADAASGLAGNGPRLAGQGARRHEHVHYALQRREPGEMPAVGADLRVGTLRVAEEVRPGDEREVAGHG